MISSTFYWLNETTAKLYVQVGKTANYVKDLSWID
jgi:hypothetical protein